MIVREAMTSPAQVVDRGSSLQEAASRMAERDIGALAVCEGDRLVGVLTDRDVTVRAVAQGKDPREARTEEFMSPEVIVCYEDQPVPEAEELMQQRKVRRLPVLDREQRLVGMLTLDDLAVRHNERCGIARTLEIVSPAAP